MKAMNADDYIAAIQKDMRQALRDQQPLVSGALQSLLARISSAEAVPPPSGDGSYDAPIAGAKDGVGSTDVPRKQLSLTELRAIVAEEIAEIQAVLDGMDASHPYTATLRDKIAVLRKYC